MFFVGCASQRRPFFRLRLLGLDPHTINTVVALEEIDGNQNDLLDVQQLSSPQQQQPLPSRTDQVFASQCSVRSRAELTQV